MGFECGGITAATLARYYLAGILPAQYPLVMREMLVAPSRVLTSGSLCSAVQVVGNFSECGGILVGRFDWEADTRHNPFACSKPSATL